MAQEGIHRSTGGVECTTARSHEAIAEFATKIPHDYEVINYKPPNCTFRVFKAK
jgi:hypothetical protein